MTKETTRKIRELVENMRTWAFVKKEAATTKDVEWARALYEQRIKDLETQLQLNLTLQEMKEQNKSAEKYRELEERFFCPICGSPIQDFTKISYTRKEMLKGYECSLCGFHGIQHFTFVYSHSEEGILE